jgi:predicted adenylyl cyclase CyaB
VDSNKNYLHTLSGRAIPPMAGLPGPEGVHSFYMSFINVEIKARTGNAAAIRQYLLNNHAVCKGTDHQTDTYFIVPHGRLKLRQGNIENNLIYYERNDQPGPKQSDFQLTPVADGASLKALLTKALGVKVVVAKKREIWFIDNVKFHIDALEGLGDFVEIEAGNKTADVPVATLHEQCNRYMQAFGIREEDLVFNSYSDMLLSSEVGSKS